MSSAWPASYRLLGLALCGAHPAGGAQARLGAAVDAEVAGSGTQVLQRFHRESIESILVSMRGKFDTQSKERRFSDRRKRRVSIVLHDRRSGFDRRTAPTSRSALAFEGVLRGLRDRPAALRIILIAANILNLADFLLTLNALAMGGTEANPLMRSLFAVDPLYAGVFKFVAILGVTVAGVALPPL